jgi:glucosylceramidase
LNGSPIFSFNYQYRLMHKIKSLFTLILASILLFINCQDKKVEDFAPPIIPEPSVEIPDVEHWLTTSNRSALLSIQNDQIDAYKEGNNNEIVINTNLSYQEIDGYGFAITGGSAKHINGMSLSARTALLNELFGSEEGQIGMSFIRISVGASDLNSEAYTYNDLASGQTDVQMNQFSLEKDEEVVIPILKSILEINPKIKIMASPWSAPAWMKGNNSLKGGSLSTAYHDAYALYLAKYIEAMSDHGINIGYLTIQNEPLHDGNNPSMHMTAAQQSEFIKNSLGPLFKERNIDTKIVIYDHNPDRTDYPLTVLNDTEAKPYIDGSAFHLYAGNISALSVVRNAHPEKNIYFTEQWFGAPGNFSEDLKWHIREVVIGSQRNWSRNVIEWNLSSNADLTPFTQGGCSQCLGGITINGDQVTRNAGYYVIAHVSKFVNPNAVRVESNFINNLPNVAFLTPENKVVLLVLNNTESQQTFNVKQGENSFSTSLSAGAVSTFIFDNN